ncbi:MAG: fumarylacetoacetate hydrolase family protein [Paracoccaceae bacterium]|nr:MAG: fumarylacetoacetate hydrolase family protein [Paracoccaceae bacterium]
MKIATVEYQGHRRLGVVTPDGAGIGLLPPGHSDMIALIAAAGPVPAPETTVALSAVRLCAPIPRPARNIMCVGKNYREHAREFARSGYEAGAVAGKDVDDFPALFSKLPGTVIAPGDTIDLHGGITSSVDYEAELAVIIGPGGRGIARADAWAHVWGYTIVNDVTARDLQRNHKQWFLGKSLDTFCPMGPWIVTADEVDALNLQVTCHVNGELRQTANTRDLIFDIPTLIATLSAGITLLPGDIIATGTPAGVGIGMAPPRFLAPGDSVEIAISGIGTLANRCA